jgi:hypothetical protein
MAEKPNSNAVKITKPNDFSLSNEQSKLHNQKKNELEIKPEQKLNPLMDKLMLPDRIQKPPNNHKLEKLSANFEIKNEYNSDGFSLKVLNDLLAFEKEQLKNKIDFSGVSQIENASQKISPSIISMDNEEKFHYFGNDLYRKPTFEINRIEITIPAMKKNTEERLKFLENTLRLHQISSNIVVNPEDGSFTETSNIEIEPMPKMLKFQPKKLSNNQIAYDNHKINKHMSKKVFQTTNSNDLEIQESDSLKINNKETKGENRKMLKLKLFEKKDKKAKSRNASLEY